MLKLTEKVEGESFLGEAYPPGVYERGLLTIPTKEDSSGLIESLEWNVYHKYIVVAYNCMGDLFITNKNSNAIGYLWLQYGYGRFIANTIDEWSKLISTDGEEKDKFLETFSQNHLLGIKGSLPYGSVYTLSPILALGGNSTIESLNNCGIGHLNVYLSIVSQSFIPQQWGEFA